MIKNHVCVAYFLTKTGTAYKQWKADFCDSFDRDSTEPIRW